MSEQSKESRALKARHELVLTEAAFERIRQAALERAAKAGNAEDAYKCILMAQAVDAVRSELNTAIEDWDIERKSAEIRNALGQPN